MWDNALECLPRWKINKLHFKCVFMDCKWYLLLISDNLAKTSASVFLIVVFFYIQFNTILTYPNMGVSWDSWHFLLNNVLFSHTCISVFAHLPFLKQHIRAPLCKKNQVKCPWESELGPKYWKVSQLTPQISVYLSQYIKRLLPYSLHYENGFE